MEGTAGGREVSTDEALQDRYVANTNSAKTLDHMFQQTFGFGSSRFSSALPAPAPHTPRHGIGRLAQDARDLPRLGGARLVWGVSYESRAHNNMLERHDSLVPRLKTEMLIIYILVMALPLSVLLASVEISFGHLVNNLLPC